ncbi:hypothetical protein SAMN05421819_3645, partial [Bryocella elongata]
MALDNGTYRREGPSLAECHLQMERILQSEVFRNANTLQQLCRFLMTRALDGGSEPLKEYTIGVEAFGQMQDFDPKTDTIVRVQTHRLRQKLKAYYDGEGRSDHIFVEIPKGHYLPRFEAAHEGDKLSEIEAPVTSEASVTPSVGAPQAYHEGLNPRKSPHRLVAGGVVALAAVFAAGWWLGGHRPDPNPDIASARSMQAFAAGQDPVKAFWASFAGDDPTPVIAYPDAVFLLDNSNDLFRYRQGASDDRGALVDLHLARQFASNPELIARAGELYYENGYTGAGELQAVAMLANLFGQMGLAVSLHQVIVFSGRFSDAISSFGSDDVCDSEAAGEGGCGWAVELER